MAFSNFRRASSRRDRRDVSAGSTQSEQPRQRRGPMGMSMFRNASPFRSSSPTLFRRGRAGSSHARGYPVGEGEGEGEDGDDGGLDGFRSPPPKRRGRRDGSNPGSRAGSRPGSRANSRPGSRAGSRTGSPHSGSAVDRDADTDRERDRVDERSEAQRPPSPPSAKIGSGFGGSLFGKSKASGGRRDKHDGSSAGGGSGSEGGLLGHGEEDIVEVRPLP